MNRTLQELLAPRQVIFFSKTWTEIGTKYQHAETLGKITGIGYAYLLHLASLNQATIAQRMSWASKRVTSRSEDIAYCLIGLMEVNMPTLYGEGGVRAFRRLQEEILRQSADQSLFAWGKFGRNLHDVDVDPVQEEKKSEESQVCSVLATSPTDFSFSGSVIPATSFTMQSPLPFVSTNVGIQGRVRLSESTSPSKLILLNCWYSRAQLAVEVKEGWQRGMYFRIRNTPLRQISILGILSPRSGALASHLGP